MMALHPAAAAANGGFDQLTEALTKQPKYLHYADYKTTDDFPLWLTGLAAKIRHAYGYKPDEDNKVKAEIVRCISGKLTVGQALDAYNSLTNDEKQNYDQLVAKLTEEFGDPTTKQKFQDNIAFNKRKKNQKFKDLKQEIQRDMDRYSGLTDAREKERQGVRRFRAGIRNIKGKRDSELEEHMNYHLQTDDELNWPHAIKVASKWELARGRTDKDSSSSDDDDDDSDDDDVRAIEAKKKKAGKTSKKKNKSVVISALADQVHEHSMKITKMETAQERMSTAMGGLKESQDATAVVLQGISQKLDNLTLVSNKNNYPANAYTPAYGQHMQQPYPQSTFRPTAYQQPYRPPPQQNQGYPQNFNARRGGQFQQRPSGYRFTGGAQQPRQGLSGNFGFQRNTPTSFPAASAPRGAAPQNSATVAAVEETTVQSEMLNAEGGEEMVSVPMSDFLSIATAAGVELNDGNMVAAVDEWNFQ